MMLHVEWFLKAYTCMTMAYGFLRAAQYRETPENVTALTVAAPALWPVYITNDTIDLLCGTRRQMRWED
jgi:hypothetical protein